MLLSVERILYIKGHREATAKESATEIRPVADRFLDKEILVFQLRKLIERDYAVFAGKSLERYFLQKFAESGKWTRLGSWWNRKGENEIDLVAENELADQLAVYEVKVDARRFRAAQLAQKVEAFRSALGLKPERPLTTGALSQEDM